MSDPRPSVDSPPPDERSERRLGLGYAAGAYLLWGGLPLYFLALAPTGPFEIVALRIVLSLVFCAILLTVTRGWRRFGALARNRRVMAVMAVAGVLIYVNWQVYVLAALTEHVVEASLGYFINPIVTILLGVFVLRERLRTTQWVAVGISVAAVIVIAVGYGAFPWISLALAFSFGLYGLVKKRVGHRIDAVSGLTFETLWLTPVAVVQLVIVGQLTGLTFGNVGVGHTLLLASAGIVTAVPLLFFAAGARRLPLTYLGFMQYSTPVIQLVIGVAILGEPMPLERWIGFGLVWAALALLGVDLVRGSRAARRTVVEPT